MLTSTESTSIQQSLTQDTNASGMNSNRYLYQRVTYKSGKHKVYTRRITKSYHKGIDTIGIRVPIAQKQKNESNGHGRDLNTHRIKRAVRAEPLRQQLIFVRKYAEL